MALVFHERIGLDGRRIRTLSGQDLVPIIEDAGRVVHAWRDRMIGLHFGLGDRFAGYPQTQSGPDGRDTQQELA